MSCLLSCRISGVDQAANSTTAKISRSLVTYFNSSVAANFDAEYLSSRQRLASVYDRIGLPLDAHLGAGGVIDELILREITRTFGRRHHAAMTATIAYLKVATMDRAIVARTFPPSRRDALVSAGQELAAIGDRTSAEN